MILSISSATTAASDADLNYALTATGAVSTDEAATAPAMDAKLMGAFLGSGAGEAVLAGVAEAEDL